MSRYDDVRAAIIELLATLNVEPGTPIDMSKIGPPLIMEKRFTPKEVMNALEMLQSEKVIDLIEGNRLVVL
jgi:DUF917 family protein